MAGRSTEIYAAYKFVLLSASATKIPTTRSVCVGTAGTATVIDADGNTCVDFPLQAGYNPLQIQALTALGTAANVWALY